ncbi:MAG: ATP-dependent Clp protease ATP-binding subunit [Oscillospiraceae bacterium]|nr:ATP-dependent Clp protease ATP-binding subunit [Oscillospiraceae bacterium]
MLCCKCKKREAVVFISRVEDGQTINEGYCMICARELGMSQINSLLDKVKDSQNKDNEKYIADLNEQFKEMLGEDGEKFVNPESMAMMGNMMKSIMGLTKDFGDGKIPQFDIKFDLGGLNPESVGEENSQETEENISPDGSENSGKSKNSLWSRKKKDKKRKYLKMYGEDLTAKAASGKIDRVIGRDREIDRTIQILNRRTKNNPCLIGEPGVGKTAIAEGLALKIVAGEVPPKLIDKEIYLLDLTALVAGTQFRGQFESRVKGLIEEVKSAENIILFIDEVHNLVGTGDSEGTMSAANILKPALSRGEVQVIGATTFNEYRKHIEKDSALERRFQPVTIEEPTIEQTNEILLGIKDYYETYHNVKLSDNIIKRAVILSERYITDRFLPDKAIDLVDEACSFASLSNKDLNKYLIIKKDIAKNKDYLEYLESQEVVDYEEIAKQKAEILKNEEKINGLEKKVKNIRVSEEHLAKVVELWTGIPAFKIKEKELKKLSRLKEAIDQKVIGQDRAVECLVKAVKRSRVQLRSNLRPASFIFVGPTGVGKTKLAQVLAQELFEGVEPLIRLDMSEYMEKFSVSRIIGSPPGYIGYDDAGQLTEKVRRKPYSVILFDEIEKAHPDVMNILLQILDDGKITDSHGRQVSFENTIIIMTSNAGSYNKESGIGFNKTQEELIVDKAKKALSDFLRPEFLARVDEIVVFKKLSQVDYQKISEIILEELKNDVLDSKSIVLNFTENIINFIAEKSYSQKSGARDIQKNIRKEIEDKICEIIIKNNNKIIKEIFFDVDNNTVIYNFN